MKFLDGPARGSLYLVKLAPEYLRVVIDRATGKVDVLDQPDDAPRPGEAVHVYVRTGEASRTHVDFRVDPEGSEGGDYQDGEYAHLADADGERLRDNAAWRSWVAGRDLAADRAAAWQQYWKDPAR